MCQINPEKKQYNIVVASDSHGDNERLERLLPIINAVDFFVFCGDGVSDVMRISGRITVPTVCVKGNNDFWVQDRITDLATTAFGSARALVVHGHRHGVRQGLALLLEQAILKDYKLVFFGHTHKYTDVTQRGVHFINPGALCQGSYAFVTGDGINFESEQCFIQ